MAGRWERPLSLPARTTGAARALSTRIGMSVTIGVPEGGVLSAVRALRADRGAVRYAEPDYRCRDRPATSSGTGTTGDGR